VLRNGNTIKIDENEGGVLFEFTDSKSSISQRFVFNLRHYNGANGPAHDGLYEFATDPS